MDFEAQEPARLYLLMVVGALFAAAGLWLLLKPKPSGTTAKIELFGLKFESSSAGVLVFLIGAAFLSLPLYVPEKPGPLPPPLPRVSNDGPSDQAAPNLAPGPEVLEAEPNDRLLAANQIALGQTVSGEVRKGNDDWFVVTVPEGPAFVELRVRITGIGTVSARFLNAAEESMGNKVLFERQTGNIKAEVPGNNRFYVWLWKDNSIGVTGTYEFSVVPAAD